MRNFLNKEKLSSTLTGALNKARTSIANVSNKQRQSDINSSSFAYEDEFIIEDDTVMQSNTNFQTNDSDSLPSYLPQNNVFDENSFDFKLVGGPLHSEVLIASATMKKGENQGLPIPLHCTWYNVSPDSNQFKEIEHVTGACYQPSIEDVGERICVHAIPASDAEEYQGMPMFAEVGPIILDQKIEQKAQRLIEINDFEFNVSIDKLKDLKVLQYSVEKENQVNVKLPLKSKLVIKEEKLIFQNLNYTDQVILELEINESLSILIVKHVNNKIEVQLDASYFGFMTFGNNIDRDVFMYCYRQLRPQILENLVKKGELQAQKLIQQQLLQEQLQQMKDNCHDIQHAEENPLDQKSSNSRKSENDIDFQDNQSQVQDNMKDVDINFDMNHISSQADETQTFNFFDFQSNQNQTANSNISHNSFDKEKYSKIEQELELKNIQISDLNENISELTNKNQDLQQQVVTFRQNYAKKIDQMKQLEESMSKLKQDVSFFKQEASLYERENKKITKQLGQLQAQKDLHDLNLQKTIAAYYGNDISTERSQIDMALQTDLGIEELESLQKQLQDMTVDRDKMIGECNYMKKKLQTLQSDNEKLQKQITKQENQQNQSQILLERQSQSLFMCGGCSAEVLDTSNSSSSTGRNYNSVHQSFSRDAKDFPRKSHTIVQNTHSLYNSTYRQKPSLKDIITPKVNQISSHQHQAPEQVFNYPSILQNSDEKLRHNENLNTINMNQDLNMFQANEELVDEFVNSLHQTMISTSRDQSFPEERLSALIEENAQMKIDLERSLEKMKQQDYLIEEYKRCVDDEIKKSNQYRALIAQKGSTSIGSILSGNKQVEQVQKLVNHLTLVIGEKDEEISVTKNINRELARKLKELTIK
ncbi:UNKNOWN [Stylonychia lemnae]|uniref:Uncharacterized protein n=1 Tax=Stylonychia lemnae TaxID=5949 RepID=A0A078B0Z9_STYLE|nr:UNKNOWN [Stylonychia lemnae]|eukprot:CDW88006.1 UNKNOWN [Stylonychia lemnae]